MHRITQAEMVLKFDCCKFQASWENQFILTTFVLNCYLDALGFCAHMWIYLIAHLYVI